MNALKKILTLFIIILFASLMGGIYGILHDQITYTISPEYYTKFKFYQFRLMDKGNEAIFPNPRFQVGVVGFRATWWMGIPIGLILGATGFVHRCWKTMFVITLKALLVTLPVAFFVGVIGLAYGQFVLANKPRQEFSHWFIPHNIVDFKSFIKVGSMHNFSYMGGVVGLIAGAVYSLKMKYKPETR